MQQQPTLDNVVRVAEASGMQQIEQSRVRIMSQHNLIHDLNDILRAYVKDDVGMDDLTSYIVHYFVNGILRS